MKKLLAIVLLTCLSLAGLTATAADRLEGALTLATDDVAALGQIQGTPDRHVMIYFGDYQH
jgi:hypothetical protein